MKRSWSSCLGVIVSWAAVGCAASPRVAAPPPAEARLTAPAVARDRPATAENQPQNAQPFDYEHESDPDATFVRETEHAIELYRQFIARAGDDPTYAAAVKQTQQQIADLNAELVFVRQGMAARNAK